MPVPIISVAARPSVGLRTYGNPISCEPIRWCQSICTHGFVRQRLFTLCGAGGRNPASQPDFDPRLRRAGSGWSRCTRGCPSRSTAQPTSCVSPQPRATREMDLLSTLPRTCSATCQPGGHAFRPSATGCTKGSVRLQLCSPYEDRLGGVHGPHRRVPRLPTSATITFCRGLNIPARYATGYLGDIGCRSHIGHGLQRLVRKSIWEIVGGRSAPAAMNAEIGRVLMAHGRDAADVALTTSFGSAPGNFFVISGRGCSRSCMSLRRCCPLVKPSADRTMRTGRHYQGVEGCFP